MGRLKFHTGLQDPTQLFTQKPKERKVQPQVNCGEEKRYVPRARSRHMGGHFPPIGFGGVLFRKMPSEDTA